MEPQPNSIGLLCQLDTYSVGDACCKALIKWDLVALASHMHQQIPKDPLKQVRRHERWEGVGNSRTGAGVGTL